MMGIQPANQGKLFYYDISLERRIPAKHLLRQIKEAVDFAFVYEEVQDCYGVNGNEEDVGSEDVGSSLKY